MQNKSNETELNWTGNKIKTGKTFTYLEHNGMEKFSGAYYLFLVFFLLYKSIFLYYYNSWEIEKNSLTTANKLFPA